MPTTPDMNVKRSDLNQCTIQLEVKCSPEQVRHGYDRAYKQLSKQIRVPGFRPGTAPKNMIKNVVSPNDINGSAAEFIVSNSLKKAMEAEKIHAHDSPSVNLTSLDEEKLECVYSAKVPLAPVVELGEYKGLPVEAPNVEVTDKEVGDHLEELRKRAGKQEAITDRTAEPGDMAVVNLLPDKTEGEGRNFMTIIGQTFADLDKALSGMHNEEIKVETLNFPENFQEKDWAGKKLKCKVTLKSLSGVQLPDLDDSFAQQLDKDFKSLASKDVDELKAKLKERLISARQQIAQEYVNEMIQEELIKRSKVEVPDTMWESVAAQRLRELEQESARKGQSIEDYAKSNGMTIEEMVQKWQEEAQIQVKRAVVAREIYQKEKMRLTNEDLNQMLVQMAYEYQVDARELAAIMQKNRNFQELEIRAVFKKVIDFLNEHAVPVEAGAKPAAKKAAPKAVKEAPVKEKTEKTKKKKTED